MPRRKRAASPAPAEVEEPSSDAEVVMADEDEQEINGRPSKRLRFDEPLTWRAGKAIPVSELLRRLKALYNELQPMDQLEEEEQDVRQSLAPKAQELANSMLLGHKDKGIRAYTMLCIVEMFRVLAPHAPYTTSQLKEIFNLFVSTIVPALATPSDPYNTQHHGILESLGTWQSIVLISDIPGSEQLILNLFSNCFDVVSGTVRNSSGGGSGDQISKNVEFHMGQMLSTLVEESATLPASVVEVILAQFLRADPNALSAGSKRTEKAPIPREVSSAFKMAQYVCNTCADKMVRHIGHYFNAVLIDASETTGAVKSKSKSKKRSYDDEDDEDDDDSGLLTPPSDGDLHEVEKAHRLLRELWRSCPDVIQNVVPQIEAELAAENTSLRVIGVQTIGDMIAGVGTAGPPLVLLLDPTTYPSQSHSSCAPPPQDHGVLLTPNAPHAFAATYGSTYQGFMDRHRDKAVSVRSAWVMAAGRIILTNGGGKGLEFEQESTLLRHIADMLVDHDEKVRLAAVQTISEFDYRTIILRLADQGGVAEPGSVLANLADRAVDPKPLVHTAALELLGRIWGVASGAIAEGHERTREIVGAIPSHILEARYKNIGSINAVVPRVLFDSLLPVGFPPIKSKGANDSQQGTLEENAPDADKIRVQRILVLLRDLNERAQKVFFQLQAQSISRAAYIEKILEHGEIVNKAREGDPKESKNQMAKLIAILVRDDADPKTAAEHINKYFDHYDRRNYALTRFCYSAESDYKRVVNAMKEIKKRLEQASNDVSSTKETVLHFLRSASLLVYNKSHVPAIMEFTRTDEGGLGSAANEILKEIATRSPTVFKAHIKELCETLKEQAPTATKPNDPKAVDALKACAGFSRRFPKELDGDRNFYNAMTKMAMHGMPPTAAKHAVTIIVSSAEKRDMYIRDIMKYCVKKFEFGSASFLSKLAAMSQLRLLANAETEGDDEAVTEIVVEKVLQQPRTAANANDPEWDDKVDDDLAAKLLALKVVVNGCRGKAARLDADRNQAELKAASSPIFTLLNTLVEKAGELSQDPAAPTPSHHRSRLRLAAAKFILKLCCNRTYDSLFLPADFNRLVKIVQDPVAQVRAGFNASLKKYLGHGRLRARFYGLIFVYAFEPDRSVKGTTETWLKARAAAYAQRGEGILEGVFPRFLSLLAHHEDFGPEPDDLADFVEYIMFYLKNVATETNLPHIYKFAQAIKAMGIQDRIDPAKSENLYILSDLSEAIIRQFQEIHGWSLTVVSGKPSLPQALFARVADHSVAQEISQKRFLPEEVADQLEDLVKASLKTRKRKSDGHAAAANSTAHRVTKKAKTSGSSSATKKSSAGKKAPRTPKSARKAKSSGEDDLSTVERRKSGRSRNSKNYAENEDSDDDEELEQWQATSDGDEEGGDEEEEEEDEEQDEEEQEEGDEEQQEQPEPTPPPPSSARRKAAGRQNAKPQAKAATTTTSKAPSRSTRGRTAAAAPAAVTEDDSESELSNPPSDDDDEE